MPRQARDKTPGKLYKAISVFADEEFDSCWISEHGLDGTTILELIGPDGRTPSEVAAAEAEQAAIEAEDAKQRVLDEEAARKERFHANLQKQRSDINELQSSFVTMRSTLKTLQGESIKGRHHRGRACRFQMPDNLPRQSQDERRENYNKIRHVSRR